VKARHTGWLLPCMTMATWLLAAQTVPAQAPPGPQSAPPAPQGGPPPPAIQKVASAKPRQTILGAWKLNKDESDNPRDRMRQNQDRGGYGGGRRGGGYPGGRGGYGGRPESEEDRARMYEMMEPPREIKLAMTGAEVDLFDNLDRKRAFITDGRKLQKSKDTSYAEIAAHWEGKRLVTDEKDALGNKMSRTFELSEDGLQLFEKIHMTMGRSGAPAVFEFVYDATDNPNSSGLR
jgi:hypothetical protein